jgi:hypothetical protein
MFVDVIASYFLFKPPMNRVISLLSILLFGLEIEDPLFAVTAPLLRFMSE